MTLAVERPAWSIAEAAELTGLTAHTLRYYERDGLLLDAVDRLPSGHRRYTEQDLSWITMITRLRATGMPIREVRAYADLCRDGQGNDAARLEILHAHRARVVSQIAEVAEHFAAIEAKIDLYEVAQIGAVERERVIRARMAGPRRKAHRGCAPTDENAARRDAGGREPIDLPIRATSIGRAAARRPAAPGRLTDLTSTALEGQDSTA